MQSEQWVFEEQNEEVSISSARYSVLNPVDGRQMSRDYSSGVERLWEL